MCDLSLFFVVQSWYQRTRTLQRASTCQTLSKFSFIIFLHIPMGKMFYRGWNIEQCQMPVIQFQSIFLSTFNFRVAVSTSDCKVHQNLYSSKYNEQPFLFKCNIHTNSKSLTSKAADYRKLQTLRRQIHNFYGSTGISTQTGNRYFYWTQFGIIKQGR